MIEKYVDVDGIRTRYLESGEGQPLVLIHGGCFKPPYSANDWDTNIDALGEHFHVYAFDKIGMGFTDNPTKDEDYVIGSTVDHAYNFLNALGIKGALVAGHSRGGYAATRLALEHPDAVKGLIIVDSSTLMTYPKASIVEQWEREAEKIANVRERQRYMIKVNSYKADHITESSLDAWTRVANLPKNREVAAKFEVLRQKFKEDLMARQEETHEWIRAGKLECPTLVVWAYNDPSATMERCGIPCMNLILPSVARSEMHVLNHAGHFSFREQPAAFNSIVVDFFRRYFD